MEDLKVYEKKHSTSSLLNHAFLKYFPMGKAEKKAWKSKKTVCLGEAILSYYGIAFLENLAFELEQFIDAALYFPKYKDRHIDSNWILQMFAGEIYGYALPGAFLGVCYNQKIYTKREFIQAFDYLGICWKLIDYWNINRDKRDKETRDFEKIERKQFNHWIKILNIPLPDQSSLNKQLDYSRLFFSDDYFLQELKNDKLTEGIVKLYGALMVKNTSNNKANISIKELLDNTILSSILKELKKITGEIKNRRTLSDWLKAIHPEHYQNN